MGAHAKKKGRIWLWILGWLFLFPLPLSILLFRNIKKKPILKIIVMAAAWISFLIVAGAANSDTPSDTADAVQAFEAVNVTRSQAADTPPDIKRLQLSGKKEVSLKVGQTVTPGNIFVSTKGIGDISPELVTFVSENPEIASAELTEVSRPASLYFEIKGVGEGETEVYALSADGSVESEHIRVTVLKPIGVEAIEITNVKTDLLIGETTTPKATVSPWNAEDKKLEWISSDETVAVVDSSGKVTASGGGTARITARAANGIEASFDVNVDSSKTLMHLYISRQRLDDFSIGHEWSYNIKINGENPSQNSGLSEGEQLIFTAEFTESDSKPDVGTATQYHTVTKEDMETGFSVSMDVYVTENGGPNTGQTAHFVVTFDYSPN